MPLPLLSHFQHVTLPFVLADVEVGDILRFSRGKWDGHACGMSFVRLIDVNQCSLHVAVSCDSKGCETM